MDAVEAFVFANPFWVWLAVAALFLTVELATGSGWLLWPAGSAAIVAVVAAFVHIGWPWELALFAGATVVTTFLGRRFMPRTLPTDPDINDQLGRLVGHQGDAAGAFHNGHGRVMVDGKEWSAEAEADAAIAKGQRVEVTAVVGGAHLRVRPA